jgi:hypothetical protein
MAYPVTNTLPKVVRKSCAVWAVAEPFWNHAYNHTCSVSCIKNCQYCHIPSRINCFDIEYGASNSFSIHCSPRGNLWRETSWIKCKLNEASVPCSLRRNMSVWMKSYFGGAMAQVVIAGLSPRRPGTVHMGFVVDRVALGQVFIWVLWFSPSIYFHCGPPYSYTVWQIDNSLTPSTWTTNHESPYSHTQ